MAHKRGKNYKPTTTIVLDDKLLLEVDNYRFENRKPNRSQAIADLLRYGIEYVEKKARVTS